MVAAVPILATNNVAGVSLLLSSHPGTRYFPAWGLQSGDTTPQGFGTMVPGEEGIGFHAPVAAGVRASWRLVGLAAK